MRRSLASLLLGMALAGGPAEASASDQAGQLAKALSSSGLTIEKVLHHEFQDLDGDGVKESLVHGEGNLRGASAEGALVVSFHKPDAPVVLPSTLAWGRFVAVFRFDRASFRWHPALIGTYRRDGVEVTELRTLQVGDQPMVRLSYERGETVHDRLFRLAPGGMEIAFSSQRGTWVGEGFYTRGRKLFTAIGLGGQAPAGRPAFLAKTRYRWDSGRFVPEFWSLSGYGFQTDLGEEPGPDEGPALRRVRELQRAADRGLATARLSLERLADRLLGESAHRVVHEKGGFGVVIEEGDARAIPHYFVRPLLDVRPEDQAIWVSISELEEEAPEGP